MKHIIGPTMEEFINLMLVSDNLSETIIVSQKIVFQHQKSLKENIEKLSSINRQILEKLEHMDVLQAGNAGWEARTLNFLLAYRRHINETGE